MHRAGKPAQPKRKRLRISIIGAGRMGSALGRALAAEGHQIQLVITKHASSARHAAGLIGGGAIPLASHQLVNEQKRLSDSDLLLISTPDDALESVAKRLATATAGTPPPRNKSQRVALHTSGALSSELLVPLKDVGFAVGSLHPLISIPDPSVACSFGGVHVCVEGQRAAVQTARSLVRDLGGRSFTISAKAKPLYHAAAVVSSGHVVALFDVAIELLMKCGLGRRQAHKLLIPLLSSTAGSLASNRPAKALTGPFARGDIGTTRKHLAAMKAHQLKDAARLYAALGLRSIRLANITKVNRNSLREIEKLLSR